MIVKTYAMLWLAMALLAAVLYVFGSLTMTAGIAFGFVAFGMVFMGMIGVLPILVTVDRHDRPTEEKIKAPAATPEPSPLGVGSLTAHA